MGKISVFTSDAMKSYLTSFDSARLKFFFEMPVFDEKKKDYILSDASDNDLLEDIRRYEALFQQNTLVRRDYGEIADRQMLVFGNSNDINNNIYIFELVRQKFLEEYIAVPCLEELYSERYFDFEWDMLVGRNFAQTRHDYYRDHFIHQVRDLFMMFDMLNSCGFYDAVNKALSDKSNGPVSKYYSQKLEQCVNDILSVPCCEEKRRLIGDANPFNLPQREAVKSYVSHYVIYAASAMATIFHDIGYPMRHFLTIRSRLEDYTPSLYMLKVGGADNFERLFSILAPSLLMKIVPPEQIKARLSANRKGDYDHGAYSAIVFLSVLYDNGSVYDLTPEQRLAVELAAVMIFNHTKKYKLIDGNEEERAFDYRESFLSSPLTFLLRVCDDLQEWDRIYYEISSFGELSICPKCRLPVVQKKGGKRACGCPNNKQGKTLNSHIEKARIIYPINACKEVCAEKTDGGKPGLYVKIDYDLKKLLFLPAISSTNVKFRVKELNKLKLYMSRQTMDGIPFVKLDYFISHNPLAIKIHILYKYFEAYYPSGFSLDDIRKFKKKFKVTPTQEENIDFYLMCVEDIISQEMNDEFIFDDSRYSFYLIRNVSCDREQILELLGDALVSVFNGNKLANRPYKEDDLYFKQYEGEKLNHILNTVNKYCNPEYAYEKNFNPFAGKRTAILDYYSDLECFCKICDELQRK